MVNHFQQLEETILALITRVHNASTRSFPDKEHIMDLMITDLTCLISEYEKGTNDTSYSGELRLILRIVFRILKIFW